MSTTPLSPARIKAAPKVLLHDHLDGGVRPSTVLELAREIGYKDLPTNDAAELAAFHLIQRENFHMTIHAGEAFGLPSIWEAVQFCDAERLGHGVRIADDIQRVGDEYRLGRLASFVRDRRIPLEVCPTSNVHTGAAATLAEHPIELLRQLRFRVTLNTDNRLMSGITLSSEFAACADAFGWTLEDMEWLTLNAAKSSFFQFDQRLALINNVIKPGYAELRAAAV